MRISEIKGIGKNVSITALISELKEEVTKNKDCFVSAQLQDKELTLPIKFWSSSFSTLEKSAGREVKAGMVVEVCGEIKEYNGKLSLNLNSKEGEVSIRIRDDLDADEYIYVLPVDAVKASNTVRHMGTKMKNEKLKEIYLKIFESIKDKLLYYPFGIKYHKEKGGALYHLFEVMARIQGYRTPIVNGKKLELNTDIMYLAALASLLGSLKKFEVDKASGKITEKKEKFCLLGRKNLALIEFCKFCGDDDSDEVLAVKHCIMCLYDDELQPALIEAKMLSNFVNNELEAYYASEQLLSAGDNEIVSDMFKL